MASETSEDNNNDQGMKSEVTSHGKKSPEDVGEQDDNSLKLDKTDQIQQDSESKSTVASHSVTDEAVTIEVKKPVVDSPVVESTTEPPIKVSPIRHDPDLVQLSSLCMKFMENNGKDVLDETTKSQTTNSILQLLVTEDMSTIKSTNVLKALFIEHLHQLPSKVVSEILSVLIAIVKKSVFHLESARGLLVPCIEHLLSSNNNKRPSTVINKIEQTDLSNHQENPSSISLTKHFLREWINLLIAHSCDVEELKSMFKLSEYDPTLFSFIQQANLRQRNKPPSFFAFPGTRGSMMSLPPFQKWPIQLGWSFSTWFFLDPKACAQPFLFNFKTGKSGLGYSAHFTGNCLVLTSIRVKGKGIQHCVAQEFPSYKWIHCAITYHNKWRASEIKVYVNGQLSANIEMAWQVQTTEMFDKCFIGGSGIINRNDRSGELNCFSGQMSAIYLFNEGLSPAQICALHRLGPSYMGQFKYSNESHVNLPPQIGKTLYEEKLASTLFCLFTPVAVESGTLCIQLAPFKSSTTVSSQNYFVSAPHAALLGQTKAIITQQICSTLQSLGCSRSLLPLLDVFASKCDPEACSLLIGFLCDLLKSSPHWFANEIVQSNGFVMVACALASNARVLLSDKLLNIFLDLTRILLTTSSTVGDSLLLKHLMDNILLSPTLWVYAETKLQIKLYTYLANEFLHGTRRTTNKYTISNSSGSTASYIAYNPTSSAAAAMSNQNYPLSGVGSNNLEDHSKSIGCENTSTVVTDILFGEIRRVSTVLQSLHALKYYYWLVEEKGINSKARNYKLRPTTEDLIIIRSQILIFIKELIVRANTAPLDEVQGLLNYLSSCTNSENVLDVLDVVAALLREHPTTMIPALDQKQGVKVFFTLIGSQSESVRVQSLKLLGLFLSQCTHKKKQDIMGPNNLFMLLCDRLKAFKPLTLEVYNALIDILIESDEPRKGTRDLSSKRIENSLVIKVIATLLYEERSLNSPSDSDDIDVTQTDIRKTFINDLWNLIVCNKENRRTILQMSVWQHWLINLINSTLSDSPLVKDQILAIFRILLYHAIRYEYGGWRVWIDTLAIIHTKVSFDEFNLQLKNLDSLNNISIEKSSSDRTAQEPETLFQNQKIPIDSSPKKEAVEKEQQSVDTVDALNDQHNITMITSQQPAVSSISERIPRESSGILMDNEQKEENETDAKCEAGSDIKLNQITEEMHEIELNPEPTKCEDKAAIEISSIEKPLDSVDVAPSRANRHLSPEEVPEVISNESDINHSNQPQSLTSIPLEDSSNDIENSSGALESTRANQDNELIEDSREEQQHESSNIQSSQPNKATASPAFRIPEFKWSGLLIKLLNDLMFSIECDLYNWRCSANCANLDTPPFVPRTATSVASTSSSGGTNASKTASTGCPHQQMESLLQKPNQQIYIINIVHFVSQLADNIVIASGALLPLLADATGGSRSSNLSCQDSSGSDVPVREGLTMAQANSLLYRLINMVDVVIFAASHINLGELEADKNTTSGGILRQCLRLACTVTVKNCLVVRTLVNRIESLNTGGEYGISASEFPKEMFDSYLGCSLLSANGLFEDSALSLDNSDLIANIEYSPHQTPNTSSMPSLLPFQPIPIRDPNKLLQSIDISRIQACIYHDLSTESRQSQFLALSSLYFISVLMVSKYRDIIEPKQKNQKERLAEQNLNKNNQNLAQSLDSGFQNGGSISSVESNIMSFGKIQPNAPTVNQSSQSNSNMNALTDRLTTKLENTLDTVCPLLKSLMCDFCSFLSKTLIGSHGQDLVNKEADRTFRKTNTSPVELVMLLCSQEWQNTLQKNAGLAFIELINEGRVLSHGMKDHIVRVAMEAEFILSRLRADDVAKHENFSLSCSETQTARLHEEVLINSLISSASRRDYVVYCKFKEAVQNQTCRKYKLDIWEDDDRRKRRFIIDSWDDGHQSFYSSQSAPSYSEEGSTNSDKNDTKRILELQQSIELGGIDSHCSPAGAQPHHVADDSQRDGIVIDKDEDCDEEDFEEDEDHQNDSNSSNSDVEALQHKSSSVRVKDNSNLENNCGEKRFKSHNLYSDSKSHKTADTHDIGNDIKNNQFWDHDDCNSVNDFTGSVIFAAECSFIWSIYAIPGVFQLTNHELYFEPNQNISDLIDNLKKDRINGEKQEDSESSLKQESHSFGETNTLRKLDLKVLRYCDFLTCNGKILLNDIRAIFSRHYLLQPNGLELFLVQRTSVMFAFSDFDTVKRVVKYLPPVGVGIKYGIPQSRRASLMSPRQLFASSNMTQKWQKRDIGNFQYLMFLNTIAGRTYQDLNQYPVFPWILTNYESDELDLNLPTNFRDLSKPVGALNNKRRSEFVERYQNWDNPKVPAFHYGTHYSTAAFTLNWLCRMRGSNNSAYLALQDGKYEEDTRLFLSIGDSWVSSLTGGNQNVKELIPEFFYLPEMFHSNLGLPEVEYPAWAKTAEQFVRMHRLALESELVSCQLHQWIDLIFGYKQRGPEAINAVNTFYYLTYQGNVNLNMIQDPSLREAIETQIKHFGQTPSQLTSEPHPPRFSLLHGSPLVFSNSMEESKKVVKLPFNTSVVHISSCIGNYITTGSPTELSSANKRQNSLVASTPSSILTITSNNQYQIHKWMPKEQAGNPLTLDPQLAHSANPTARRQLIDVDDICSSVSLKLHNYINGCQDILDEIQWACAHYVVTLDGRYIIMGSFYDNSFRVFMTENGKLCQVIYGHRGPITCIARSDGNAMADFYIATGSQDCSVLLWNWNERYAQVEGSGVSAVHNPLPKLTISGHQTPILSVFISSELGLIISGSKNLILVNTTTAGDNLLEIDVILPSLLDKLCFDNKVSLADNITQRPQVKDKQKSILEASMLGDGEQSLRISKKFSGEGKSAPTTRSHSLSSNVSERFSHLKELCHSDYYITNLQLARELGFIVCVALPPPRRIVKLASQETDSNTKSSLSRLNSTALLMNFNLKGSLMECTTFGQPVNGPKLGDVCCLQTTRDGEHLILNDSPSTLKIYRTFDLQSIYSYDTNDLPDTITLRDEHNRIKSLTFLETKYVLVGLENGKIIVYIIP